MNCNMFRLARLCTKAARLILILNTALDAVSRTEGPVVTRNSTE